MDFFNGWIQGIVIAVIITILIEMILPDGNSKKYIKIILGIYVVFSIISPIISKITGGEFEVSSIINMDKYAKELGTYEEMQKSKNTENKNSENIKQIYIKKLKEDITSKLKNKGYATKNVELNIEDDESFGIRSVTIYIEKNTGENQDENKKNNINAVNEIKIEKIKISKQEENKEEMKESNVSFFESNDITKYISETYGINESQITIY